MSPIAPSSPLLWREGYTKHEHQLTLRFGPLYIHPLDVQVLLSQRDLERNVKRKFTRTIVASVKEKENPLLLSGPSIDTGDLVAKTVSSTGKFEVALRSVAGEKKRNFVEVNGG